MEKRKLIYLNFVNKNCLGVRSKIVNQIKVWNSNGFDVIDVGLPYNNLFFSLVYRYYCFIKYFFFTSSDCTLYIRQFIPLPFVSMILKSRKYLYEINADLQIESKHFNYINRKLVLIYGDIGLKYSSVNYFVSNELHSKHCGSKTLSVNYVFPNAIHRRPAVTKKIRENKIVFIGNDSFPWQGTDFIYVLAGILQTFEFNLIGKFIDKIDSNNIIYHGELSGNDLHEVLSNMDYGIGTLAFFRSGLVEGSPLKVRKYIEYDLPFIVGYIDSDFNELPFCHYVDFKENISKNDILEFLDKWKSKSYADSIDSRYYFNDRELIRSSTF